MTPSPEAMGVRMRKTKLFQWAAAYLAGAWLAVQALDILSDRLALPGATFRVALSLLAVGFFAVLVLAWYHGEKGAQRVSGPELVMIGTLLIIAAGVVAMVRGEPGLARAQEAIGSGPNAPQLSGGNVADHASLAVLPFTNLSSDPENAYFAGGIHDELLTQLSRVPGLRVISRTTMLRYEGSEKSTREIAAELGVGAVMEGSVQRVGNRVKIIAQLIDAATDSHLWSNSYDRELTDVFAVQNEVAQAVATSLHTALSPQQAEALDRRPTENAEAYALYLRGIDYLGRGYREENLRTAARMLQRAVGLDPEFAQAWAGLSRAQSRLYWFSYDLDDGRKAAARALELAPELPAARIAMALVHFDAREYDQTLELAEPLLAELPNFADATLTKAWVYQRQGRLGDALRLFQRVIELDPASGSNLHELAGTYGTLHRFSDMEAMYKRAIEVAPDDAPNYYVGLGRVYLEWRGDLKAARDAVARMPDRFAADRALQLAWYDAAEGQYQQGLDRLVDVPPGVRTGFSVIGIWGSDRPLVEGVLLERLGRTVEARSRYRAAADALEAIVNAKGFNVQGQTSHRSALAVAYAGLGLKERAIATVQQSARELPVSLDAMYGPTRLVDAAKVYAMVGEKDQAVAALEQALSNPISDTSASLRLDPLLASLRGYPPFEQLMDRTAAASPPR